MKKIMSSVVLFVIILSNFLVAQKYSNLEKTNISPHRTKFNINNISTFINNNGDSDLSPSNDSGCEFPKGSDKTVVYESGLVWGGKIDGKIYVGGNTYNQGIVGGRILEDGTPQNPDDPDVRVYRVRPDYASTYLFSEVEDESLSDDELRNQYQLDWNEWPAEFGAPYEDLDNNGIYDPSIDIPGVPGADQTLWFVANDFDEKTARSLYGSDPMKLEIQVTIWGYINRQTPYDNVFFKKYKLINKNSFEIDSMYISSWADPDLGGAGDDYVGCDTLLNLSYCYNGDDDDTQYGSTIPAVGFQLIQGPLINGDVNDIGYSNGKQFNGMTNLNYTAFSFFIGGDDVYTDPDLGNYVDGTLGFYNLMRGRRSATGFPFFDPTTGLRTKFTLAGDPVTQTGWIDGILHGPGDRRSVASSGPFTLAIGDTQEVVIAQMVALGTDRLNSVKLLKYYASLLQNNYPGTLSQLPTPISPIVNISESRDGILLSWDNEDRNNRIENFDSNGYSFQGYNVYQINSDLGVGENATRLATFDIVDGITNITGTVMGEDGKPVTGVQQFGTDSGISREYFIDKDYINNDKLLKGKKYYFAVSSYTFNKDSTKNNNTESKSSVIIVEYIKNLEGTNSGDIIEVTQTNGSADIEVDIEVYDPDELTGDTYEITFGKQHYYLDDEGEWKKTNYPDSIGNALNKPNDQTPSTLVPLPSIYSVNQTLNLHFAVENNAPDFNYIDAVSITFPDGITINSANDIYSNHPAFSIIEGQTVTWGEPGATSTDGPFSGGEDIMVNINFVEPTFTVNYVIYDDGWSEAYVAIDSQYFNAGNGTVDGDGKITLNGEIGHQFKTERYWDLHNKTKDLFTLEYQTIFAGRDINTRNLAEFGYEPIVDGFRIKLDGSFDAPINFSNISLKKGEGSTTTLSSNSTNSNLDIQNYTIFGGVVSSNAIDNFGAGTSETDQLEQDYELRFTGVYDQGTVINGVTVHQVIEGGSMATCFRMSSATDLANNPLNPKYGTAEPFMVRIPFEVWNVEDPENPYQVNLTYRDRIRNGTEDPFWAWNPTNRMYSVIVNAPYNDSQIIQIDDGSDEFNTNATWVLVHYGTNYHLNDVVKINYNNPITLDDVITFNSLDVISNSKNKNVINDYKLSNNYPNPFNPTTKISYSIPKDEHVNISIYNILGQRVSQIINKSLKAGKYETTFNGSKLASGIYIYRIVAGDFIQTKKMMLLK